MSETPTEFTPTPADQWQKPQTVEVVLPSGMCALMRRPNYFFLAKTGQVPENVKKAASNAPEGKDEMPQIPDVEFFQNLALVSDFLIAKSFVQPKCSLEPKKGHVCVDDIDAEDKQHIMEVLEIKL